MNLKLKILFCALFFMPCVFLYAQDPLGPKLKVDGEIEISLGKSLRIKPVPNTAPASAQTGDLYWTISTLRTWTGTSWSVVSEKGDLFYDDNTASLYYRDNTEWRRLGGKGPKTVASRIVAASNSQGTTGCPGACTNPRADYVCNGTDDQQEINRAINDLGTVGGAVYLLEGTYNISDVLLEGETLPGIVMHNNTAIIGTGRGTVLKAMANLVDNGIIDVSRIDRILITNLTIDGNERGGVISTGIYFRATNSKIDKVWVYNTRGFGIYSFGNYNTISNNHITDNTVSAGLILYGSNYNIVSNNICNNNQQIGIDLEISSNNIVSGNICCNNTYTGIQLWGSSNNNTISGNICRENIGANGISVTQDSSNNAITGNTCSGNGVYGIDLHIGCSYNTISGNVVQGNGFSGIELYSTAAACSNNVISGNTVIDNGGDAGIKMQNSKNNLISSNLLNDNAGTSPPIYISSDCENNYLVANHIGSWPAGYNMIRDLGTNTTYTDKLKMTLEKKTVTSGFSPLNVATNPRTYVALNPGGAITLTLAAGKAAGDLLILENVKAASSVTLSEGATVNLGAASRVLGQYDTLELIWNGSKWIEVKYVDN